MHIYTLNPSRTSPPPPKTPSTQLCSIPSAVLLGGAGVGAGGDGGRRKLVCVEVYRGCAQCSLLCSVARAGVEHGSSLVRFSGACACGRCVCGWCVCGSSLRTSGVCACGRCVWGWCVCGSLLRTSGWCACGWCVCGSSRRPTG